MLIIIFIKECINDRSILLHWSLIVTFIIDRLVTE